MTRLYSKAIGLNYCSSLDSAPRVALKGEGAMADLIVSLAKRYGVAVIEDSELASALSASELDQDIDESLYRAVAVVLNQIEMAERAD